MTAAATRRSDIAEFLMGNKAMRQALVVPIPGNWPEKQDYTGAEQAKAIGRILVEHVHKHLVNAEIGYLFREAMSRGTKVTLAKATRVSGKLAFYAKLDFCVDVNWTAWKELTPEQRVALIDHELSHFDVDEKENGDKVYITKEHDVEEFGAIVSRWGLWQPDLKRFHRVMVEQLALFPAVPEPAGAPALMQ